MARHHRNGMQVRIVFNNVMTAYILQFHLYTSIELVWCLNSTICELSTPVRYGPEAIWYNCVYA